MDKRVLVSLIQRRRIAVVACALACIEIHFKRYRRRLSIRRPIFTFGIYIQGLRPAFFSRMYRMSQETFFLLAVTINDSCKGKRLRSCPLLRLSITIRWLGGGSYLDLAVAHHISISSVYNHIDNTITAIDESLKLRFPYDDDEWLAQSSYGFSRNERSPLTGCCAALDGIAISITEPSSRDVPNSSTYYNRKGFFALNVQALCDSTYRFLFVSAVTPGSTHDSTAIAMSSLASLLSQDNGGISGNYWIAADEAYICNHRIVCPWPGKNLPVEKDCFNYWQSSARIHIEQAFGMLVARWGIFWRPLRVRLSKAAKIVAVCCKLHNFILDNTNTITVPNPSGLDNSCNNEPIDQDIHLQDTCHTEPEDGDRCRYREESDIRAEMTEAIREEGLQRPAVY